MVLITALLAACSQASAVPQPNTGHRDPAGSSSGFEGTTETIEQTRSGYPALLSAVHTERHSDFDRVIFELSAESSVPGYHVELLREPPQQCGSGDAVEVAGSAHLEVRMYPMNAHTEAGQPTIPFRERALSLPAIAEIERTCDFEAVTTWVVGMRERTSYRVSEASSPARLIVDIEHAAH